MRRGFTLIELLAVIVILAIILLISVPLIGSVIENVKKSAAESSAKGLYKAAQFTHSNNMILGVTEDVVYTFTNGDVTSNVPEADLIYYSGDKYDGHIRLRKDGTVMMNIYNGIFCFQKGYSSSTYTITKNTEEECLAVQSPELTLLGMSHFKMPINGTYSELGFEAYDLIDGDLTASVAVTGTVDETVEGIYSITYTVTDTEENVATVTRNIEVIDIYKPVNGRYVIFEVNDHYASDLAAITEVDVFDNNSTQLIYTPITSYDSNRSGLPQYWSAGEWDAPRFNDNVLTNNMVGNATAFLYTTAANSGAWNRTVLDLGSVKTISSVDIYSGSSDLRIPHNVKIYITDSYNYATNIAGKSDTGLAYIGRANFLITNTSVIRKNVSTVLNTIELVKETTNPVIGSLKIYANGVVNDEIVEMKWSLGVRNEDYFVTAGTAVQNGYSFDATENGTYTAYLKTATGAQIITTTTVSNIDAGPAITLNDGDETFVLLNDPYNEPGATAFDVVDNESKDVTISGTVNTAVAGDYTITYTATDSNGTIMTKTRNVVVRASIYNLGNYTNVYYVSSTGNDTTGNGTEGNPWLTIAKAYTTAVNGDAIYLKGNFNLTSAIDLTKDVDFLGSYITHGSKITMNNYRQIGLNFNKTTKFYGIYFESSGSYEIFDGYRGADSYKGNVELHNCVVKNTNAARNVFLYLQSMKMYNTLLIANITEMQNGYTANATYVNVAVTGANIYPGTNSTVTTSSTGVTYNATTFALTSAGWQNTGTGLNRDGSVAHRGVYGGQYGW